MMQFLLLQMLYITQQGFPYLPLKWLHIISNTMSIIYNTIKICIILIKMFKNTEKFAVIAEIVYLVT